MRTFAPRKIISNLYIIKQKDLRKESNEGKKMLTQSNIKHLIPILHSILWFCGLWIALMGYEYIITESAGNIYEKLYTFTFSYLIFLSEVVLSFFDIGFSESKKAFNSKVFVHCGVLALDLVFTILLVMLFIKYEYPILMLLVIIMSCILKYISSYMVRNKDFYFEKNSRGATIKTNNIGS